MVGQKDQASPREAARHLILNELGARQVAAWCGVDVGAVWQWLSRSTDEVPFPPARVLTVAVEAYRAGRRFDLAILWPAFAELRAELAA